MTVLIWGVLALAAGFAVVWIASLRAMPKPAPLPADLELPATPMQRSARWSLLGALVFAAAAAIVLLTNGPEHTYDDDNVRLLFTLLILAAILIPGVATIQLKRRAKTESSSLDERDHTILERAPAFQALATLVTLAVWIVGIAEQFHDAGAVPLFYLYLLFWSCLLMYVIGLPVGILVGYRRV